MQNRISLIVSLAVLFSLLSWSFGQNSNSAVEQNKQLILRLFGEVFNGQAFAVIDELYQKNMTDHSAFPDQPPGVEGIRSAIKGFFDAFDDIKISVEDVIAEDDRVVTRELWQVKDKESGKAAQGTVIHIFRIRDGKISDEWSRGWDWLENI
jgi:ketosteroid isomerase-like protein